MNVLGHEIVELSWLWKTKLIAFSSKSTDYSVSDCINISIFEQYHVDYRISNVLRSAISATARFLVLGNPQRGIKSLHVSVH